jgi:hypothetical protein
MVKVACSGSDIDSRMISAGLVFRLHGRPSGSWRLICCPVIVLYAAKPHMTKYPRNGDCRRAPLSAVLAMVPSVAQYTIKLGFFLFGCMSIRIRRVRAPLAVRAPQILKVKVMEVPAMLQGDSLKRLLQGAAVGAVVTMVVGFNWGGWTLGGTVEKVAKERADAAVVAVLSPICVDQFRQAVNAAANLSELTKSNYSWDRDVFVEKGGWAIMPGSETASPEVGRACAQTLATLKAADLR